MRRTLILSALLGLLIATGLIAYYGVGAVFTAAASVGWGLLAIVSVRALVSAGDGLAWRFLLPASVPRPLLVFMALRWIRDAVNALLPVGQVGGDVVGARLLTFFGVSASLAGASVIVDLLLLIAAQFLFTLLGFALLVAIGGDDALVMGVGIGLLVAAPAVAGFLLAQRLGLLLWVERLLVKVADRWQWGSLGRHMTDLHADVQSIYRDRRGLVASFALHFAVWFVGIAEIWLALHFMGYTISFAEALVLESLSHAVRSAAFLVPGALGVQEGGFIVLCALFGIGPEIALALSLVKRVPDLVLGVPGLLAWQTLEGRRLLPRGKGSPEDGRERL